MTRLVDALKEVGQTFELFQRGELGSCDSTPSAIPVANLVPSSYCQVPGVVPSPGDEDLRIDPNEPNIDVRAKFALQRMRDGEDMEMREAARILILGRKTGELAGIYGDDLGKAVEVARDHGTERWLLVPREEDAALVLVNEGDPLNDPPTVIFRGDTPDISKQPGRLDEALQKASKTFALFQDDSLDLCAGSPSAKAVPNLYPSSYCRLPRQDLLVEVTEEGTQLPVIDAGVRVVGPSRPSDLPPTRTDDTGHALFHNLAPGSYQVTVSKEGFEEASANVLVGKDHDQAATFAGKGTLTLVIGGGANLLQVKLSPKLRVKEYKRSVDDDAPTFNYDKTTSGSIWLMDILRGSHTAVTFVNSGGHKIESNNPNNAVPRDKDVWIDPNSLGMSRDIFFYGVRMPLTDFNNPIHIALFHLGTVQPRRTPLQVRVFLPSPVTKPVLIKLYGRSMSLNAKGLRMYQLDVNKSVKKSELPKDVINLVKTEVKENGPLIHLVINAHGNMRVSKGGIIDLGLGFDRNNLYLWAKLQHEVKYLWFMNCWIGQDNDLFAAIAQNTQAWVSAYPFPIGNPPKVPAGHIEYLYSPTMKHWDGPNVDLTMPAPKKDSLNLFFRSARFRKVGNLKYSLYFNVVPDPKQSYP